jgi:plastocyanin
MSSNLQPSPGPSMAVTVKKVGITDDHGHVETDEIHLSRGAGDAVEWVAMNGKQSTVAFRSVKGSPFQDKIFHVPANGNSPTATVRKDAETGEYKYDVIGEKGENDPVVIIHN